MGIRVAPSAIRIHLRTFSKGGRVPQSVPDDISIRLSPLLEEIVDLILIVTLANLGEENSLRKTQGAYVLSQANLKHFDKAAKEVVEYLSKSTHMYINKDHFDNIRGEQRGETKQPSEPSESTDP